MGAPDPSGTVAARRSGSATPCRTSVFVATRRRPTRASRPTDGPFAPRTVDCRTVAPRKNPTGRRRSRGTSVVGRRSQPERRGGRTAGAGAAVQRHPALLPSGRLTGSDRSSILDSVSDTTAQGRSTQTARSPRERRTSIAPASDLAGSRSPSMAVHRARSRNGPERLTGPAMSRLATARRPAAPLRLAASGADARRRRRRQVADARLYCGTNGCPTTLVIDVRAGVASCPICGYRRRIH